MKTNILKNTRLSSTFNDQTCPSNSGGGTAGGEDNYSSKKSSKQTNKKH